MIRIELNIDESTLEQAQNFAVRRGVTIQSLLEWQLKNLAERASIAGDPNTPQDPLTGIFEDCPDMMDQIVEDAMRERAMRYSRTADV